MVANLVEPERFTRGRECVEASSAWYNYLSDTLPLSSLHMTVCGIDSLGRNEESKQAVKRALEEFKQEVLSSGQSLRACGVTTVRPSGLCLRLRVKEVQPREPFVRLREALLRACSSEAQERGHDPKDGALHVTLGWYVMKTPDTDWQHATEKSLEEAYAAFEAALASVGREIPLDIPHLSNYPNMASFPNYFS